METNDVFANDEDRKDFYLKEFALMYPDLCVPDHTEEEYLAILQREQKETQDFLGKLWNGSLRIDMESLCKVVFFYLMCDDIAKEERVRVSNDIRFLFSLLSLLQQKLDVTAGLLNLYRLHEANMKRLTGKY